MILHKKNGDKVYVCDYCQIRSDQHPVRCNVTATMAQSPRLNSCICYDCAVACVTMMDQAEQGKTA